MSKFKIKSKTDSGRVSVVTTLKENGSTTKRHFAYSQDEDMPSELQNLILEHIGGRPNDRK